MLMQDSHLLMSTMLIDLNEDKLSTRKSLEARNAP